MKISIAQIKTQPGNIEKNTRKIISNIKKAKKNKCDIIVFPELTIPGYCSMDLIFDNDYVKQNIKALDKIRKETQNIAVIVGFIDMDSKGKYNSAAFLADKKLFGVTDKINFPNYDIFFEKRYFNDSRKSPVYTYKGRKFGIEICEDMWDDGSISKKLFDDGAEFIINLSASPFYIGKAKQRLNQIQNTINPKGVYFVYANLVGSYDGFDSEIAFDGHSLIFDKDTNLISQGKPFREELIVVDTKTNNKSQDITKYSTEHLYKALVMGIKDYFTRSGFKKAFFGLSGGIDSAVISVLLADALKKNDVTAVLMPSKFTSKESNNYSLELIKNLDINHVIVPIKKTNQTLLSELKKNFDKNQDITMQNIQARLRGIILMSLANSNDGLVISTSNKTEAALGYSTLYGDMCGALAPMLDISKNLVYDLSKYINSKKEVIPRFIIEREPTAELRPSQTDEKSIGIPYKILSPLVDDLISNMPKKNLSQKYEKKHIEKVSSMIKRNEYKRRQSPPGIKVTKKSFGIGRRIPI
ncbi:MAG: NAD+ synthase, partial [Nanoarchaeota archaeon]